jgi:hypothetical protein
MGYMYETREVVRDVPGAVWRRGCEDMTTMVMAPLYNESSCR